MTRARNWWDYHKWLVLLSLVCLLIAALLLHGLFSGDGADMRIGCVTMEPLSEGTVAALMEAVKPLCADLNGDGRVTVEIEQFVLDFSAGANPKDMETQMANITRMTGSIYAGDGADIFLLDDPEGFQRRTGALQYIDGTLPLAENGYDTERWSEMVLACADCPALAGLGEVAEMYIGRCAPNRRSSAEKNAATDKLWRELTGK